MDKPDRVFLGPPVKRLPDGSAVFRAGDAYLATTPERELASELVEALRDLLEKITDIRGIDIEEDYAPAQIKKARAVLDKLEGKG